MDVSGACSVLGQRRGRTRGRGLPAHSFLVVTPVEPRARSMELSFLSGTVTTVTSLNPGNPPCCGH